MARHHGAGAGGAPGGPLCGHPPTAPDEELSSEMLGGVALRLAACVALLGGARAQEAEVVICTAPENLEGYSITSSEMNAASFSVEGECAEGYTGALEATACTENGPYTITGCTAEETTAEGGGEGGGGETTGETTGEGGEGAAETHGEAHETEHGNEVWRGGHLSEEQANKPCKPVICDEELRLHDPLDYQGCRNYTVNNLYTNASETLLMTCQGCVPRHCDHGEHDCVPVSCEIDGSMEGGYTFDPCEQGHHGGDGLSWWPFLLCCLLGTVGVTSALKAMGNGACCGKSINPPFTVVMFFLGYLMSSIASKEQEVIRILVNTANENLHFTEIFFESIISWKGAHPHIILFVLLPPLLFEDASSMDYYTFRKVLMSSILLAGPGVGFGMICCAACTMMLFGFATECVVEEDHVTHARYVVGTEDDPECIAFEGDHPPEFCTKCQADSPTSDQLPFAVHLLLGGMLSATDPVAVCAVLNDLGCPDKLNFMIAGESLLNDGTAVVIFLVLQSVCGGCDTNAAKATTAFVRLAGGGVLWGLFVATVSFNYIKAVRDPNIEITTLLFSTFACFWVAENVIGVSGVLGTVVFGVQTARTSFMAMDQHTHHANHSFWSEVGYVATSCIFILAGVKSRDKIARFIDEASSTVSIDLHIDDGENVDAEFDVGNQMVMNVVLWFLLTIVRSLTIFVLSPILRQIGYGLTVKEAAVMVWGGLRGAVSLSLALLVDGNHQIGDRAREMIFLQTAGIVTLTLIVNGTTSGMVYKALKVYPPNAFRPVLATQGLRNLQLEMEKFTKNLENHWFHSNADLDLVLMMFPNFSESHIYDGDLVDIKQQDMHAAWGRTITKDSDISPQRMGLNALNKLKSGGMVGLNALRRGYKDTVVDASGKEKDATKPDSYAEIGLQKGADSYQTFETSIVLNDSDPVWDNGNVTKFFVPPGEDDAVLYVHMFENDIGENDNYLGQARIDLNELIEANGTKEGTYELQTCDHVLKLQEYDGTFPTEVSGSVTVKVQCLEPTVTVTLIKAEGIGDCKKEDMLKHGDHDHSGHEHGHGHGHGTSHALLLKNVKRWIDNAEETVDSSHAMYEILLTNIKSGFIHDRENKLIGVASYNRLNSALGVAFDLNMKDMEEIQKIEALTMAGDSGTRMAKQALEEPEKFGTPVEAMVNYMIDFADNGLPFGGRSSPTVWFEHRLTLGESLLAVLGALKNLAVCPNPYWP